MSVTAVSWTSFVVDTLMSTTTVASSIIKPNATTINNFNITVPLTIQNITKVMTEQTEADNDKEVSDLINNEIVQILFCVLYSTVFVLGVFGNVLVCYVVLRNRAMQTVTNIFITNLALSDILLCVLAVPFTPLYTFMGRWAFGRTLCHLVSFAQGCSIYISTLTLTSIAVDRYFVIIYPFHPRMKLSTCIGIIVTIWVFALLATLPYGMYMKVVSDAHLANMTLNTPTHSSQIHNSGIRYNYTDNASIDDISIVLTTRLQTITLLDSTSIQPPSMNESIPSIAASTSYCEENWPSEHYRKVFGSVTTILQFVLPFIIISICYTWVSVKLNARARAKPGSKSSRREEADRDRKKRTNRMLIAMVAVFGLSWLPINVVNIFDDFYEKSNEWRFYTLFFFVAHSIAMSSTCYNPFLYAWLNENFRKEFKHVLPCFNPSNNNIINITRYNRSERNTCGPRLHHDQPGGDIDADDDNGITQETSLHTNIREKMLIIPREATYGNGSGNGGGSGSGNVNTSGKSSPHTNSNTKAPQVDILLNDKSLRRGYGRSRQHNDYDLDIDSGDEQTVEMRFCETPFVSSDNTTTLSMQETGTTNETEYNTERDKKQMCN